MAEIATILHKGLEQLNLTLEEEVVQKLLSYVELLQKWNKTYNLTAIRKPKEIVIRHILDSLTIIPYLSGDLVLDVGSGPGVPGLVLALVMPHKHFVLLDSNSKKIRFLEFVKLSLAITNSSIVRSQVETFVSEQKFDCIIARAVGSVAEMVAKTEHLLSDQGELLLMKGKVPEQELAAILHNYRIQKLTVPFLSADRCLVIIPQYVS